MARLLSPLRLAAAGVVLLAVVLVVLVTRGSNQYLEVPDEAHPLQGLVQVPGAKPPKNGGDIYYVDVLLRPASLLESWLPAVRPEGSDIIARTQIVEPGISDKERFQLDLATIRRWRREAITASAQDRLWMNRCEALCNALLRAEVFDA